MAQTGDPIAPKISRIKGLANSTLASNDSHCYLADLQPEIRNNMARAITDLIKNKIDMVSGKKIEIKWNY